MKKKTVRPMLVLCTAILVTSFGLSAGAGPSPTDRSDETAIHETPIAETAATSDPLSIPDCFDALSDDLDPDEDLLSDRVEGCFLGTDPLEPDTDQDGILDGLDATPLERGLEIPMIFTIQLLKLEHEEPDGSRYRHSCDEENLADPYITRFTLALPSLDIHTDLSFGHMSKKNHPHDKARFHDSQLAPSFSGAGTGNNGKAHFTLDPDLSKWPGDQDTLDLVLQVNATVVDHDHHFRGNDDIMKLDTETSILGLGGVYQELSSSHATDADTDHIHCQFHIDTRTFFYGLAWYVLDTAKVRIGNPGELVQCASPGMDNCGRSASARPIEQ